MFNAELSLTAALKRGSDVDRSELDRILTVMDATLPELSRTLATIWAIESPANLIQIPSRDPDLRSFALAVERERLKDSSTLTRSSRVSAFSSRYRQSPRARGSSTTSTLTL